MVKSKYDINASVSWKDVRSCIRWAITQRKYRAQWAIEDVQTDIEHHYPDKLQKDIASALSFCEQVFFYVNLYNELGVFLRYKAFTPERLGLSEIYVFYSQHAAHGEGGDCL